MSSNINPNNIDSDYPIAGHDNDSQGFRDNFTNIKTNFENTKAELEDLQGKVVLKDALIGAGVNPDNDLDGETILSAVMQDMRVPVVDAVAGAIDVSAASYYRLSVADGDVSLSFTGWPNTDQYAKVVVEVTVTHLNATISYTYTPILS